MECLYCWKFIPEDKETGYQNHFCSKECERKHELEEEYKFDDEIREDYDEMDEELEEIEEE